MARNPVAANAALALLVALALVSPAAAQDDNDVVLDLGRGDVVVHVPSSYDPGVATPLVLLLHGYGSSGQGQESYMQLLPLHEERGFLYAYPDGTRDIIGARFWNATDFCCDFFGAGTDDSGYLLGLIDAVKAELNVDADRVWLVGHSNGGFMSYRMACDHPETIAAIASLAGATWDDAGQCSPAAPVHVLQMHGTLDSVVRFGGDCIFLAGCYPGAVATVKDWVQFDGCDPVLDTSTPNKDLDSSIPGDETVVGVVDQGCEPGGSAELWAIVDGAHSPFLSDTWADEVIDYLYAHPKSP